MKKITMFVAAFAFVAFFTTAGFAHAQTNTGTNATINAAASVDGVAGPKANGSDKPGSVRPQPIDSTDYRPMPKDPAAQKKLMDLQADFKNARARCATLSSKAALVDCESKADVNFKKLEAEVKATYKISDEEMKRKNEMDRPKTDAERKEDRKEDRTMNAQTRIDQALKELNALYNRFSEIGDRIDARIKVLTSTNVTTDVSQKYLSAARADLARAQTAIAALSATAKIELSVSVNDDTTKTRPETTSNFFVKTKAQLKETKDALMSARENLLKAVRNLPLAPSTTKAPVNVNAGATVNTQTTAQPVQ